MLYAWQQGSLYAVRLAAGITVCCTPGSRDHCVARMSTSMWVACGNDMAGIVRSMAIKGACMDQEPSLLRMGLLRMGLLRMVL